MIRRIAAVVVALAVGSDVTATDPNSDSSKATNVYVVCAGVNRPVTREDGRFPLGDLKYAERDVERLAETLIRSGYPRGNVVVLTLGRGKVIPRLLPTATNIVTSVRKALKSLGDDDLLVVALAGHGVQAATGAFFCPADTELAKADTLVSLDALYGELSRHAKGRKVLLADSCRRSNDRQGSDPPVEKGLGTKGVAATDPAPGRAWWIHSCRPSEVAKEDDRLQHGVFFHHAIEALRGRAARNGARVVTLKGLEEYVKDQLRADPPTQTPWRQGSPGDTWLADCTPILDRVARLAGHRDSVEQIAYAVDGTRAFTSDGDSANVWDLATQRRTLNINDRKTTRPHLAPTNTPNVLALSAHHISNGATVRVVDTVTGQERAGGLVGAYPSCIAGNPARAEVAAAYQTTADGRHVRIWDAETLQPKQTILLAGVLPQFMSFSSDGRYLATAARFSNEVTVYDTRTAGVAGSFNVKNGGIFAVSVAPGNREVVVVTNDPQAAVQVWDLTGPKMKLLRATGPNNFGGRNHIPHCGGISADGRMAGSASGGQGIIFWDTLTMQALKQHDPLRSRCLALAFAPDCSSAMCGGDRGELFLYTSK